MPGNDALERLRQDARRVIADPHSPQSLVWLSWLVLRNGRAPARQIRGRV